MPAQTGTQPPSAPAPEESDAAWEQSLQALLERVAAEGRAAQDEEPAPAQAQHARAPAEPRRGAPPMADPPAPPAAADLEEPALGHAHADGPVRPPRHRHPATAAAGAAAAVALAAMLLLAWRGEPGGTPPVAMTDQPPQAALGPSAAPPAAAPVPLLPARSDQAAQRTLPRDPGDPAAELAARLSPLALRDLRGVADATLLRTAGKDKPTLLLARYDTLQALPDDSGRPALRLVSPLFVEPVHAWVRSDSTLQHLHDLAGRRLVATPTGSTTARAASGALSGAGSRLPMLTLVPDDSAALAALQAGRADAWLQVGLAAAPPATAGLRALLLDRSDARTATALRRFLPLRAAQGGGEEMGVMVFLAAAGRDDPAIEPLAAAGLQALCRGLPDLVAQGHPAWATVRPARTLPAGHPYARASAWPPQACGSTQGETSR